MEGKSIKKIANYQITSTVIGKAYDHQQKPVAAKVIALSNLKNQQIESLQRELNMLRKCRHENIVSLLDAKKTINNFYIFLEYCEQGTLDDLIKEKGKLEEGYAISLFYQIMKGMEIINACKIVHRDIKPANILIHKGVAKIADFGLAKKNLKEQLFQTFAGTPFNMAPEILKGQPYSQKVDVYSIGTVLYQMIFGKAPFQAQSVDKLLKAIKCGIKTSKSSQISSDIIQLIKQMLEPDPQKRIRMHGILQFLYRYNNQILDRKLRKYKKLSWKCLSGIGAVGCMIGALGLQNHCKMSASNMDLRLLNKFSQRMAIINLS